ncbi:MAG: hypothetical protein M1587_10400, partial [Thaumarchaeota archaeon]|nr:hypothetical protein [Nitrososphaerota archaeon]
MSQLVNLKLNLFKYEGKPFADGVSVWIYKPKQAVPDGKYFLVESATKSIEKAAGENSVAAQYGSSIYVVSVNSANLGSSVIATDESTGKQYSWVLSPTQESLLPQYDEGREVLRRLLAKAITNKQILRKWFVERYRIVYHYSYAMSQPLSGGPFEVYQGFIFRPFVFKDGSAAVLLDPKFKFVPRETLRDYLERLAAHGYTAEDIQTLLVDEIVIDHCPIVECTLRNTPGSPCRLRGSGKRRQLVGLDFTRKPSATAFGDLIAYNRDTV